MRKFFAIVLTMLLAISLLAGCGGGGGGSGSGGGASPDSIAPKDTAVSGAVSVLWHGGLNQTNKVQEVVQEQFNAIYPDVTVEFTEVTATEIGEKCMLEVASKSGAYDVAMQYQSIPALVNLSGLFPLDEYIARDEFPIEDMIDNGIRYKDKIYGLPMRGDVRVLHYNEDHFIAAGLDPDKPPVGMEQYEEYSRILTRDGIFGVNRRFSEDCFVAILYEYGGDLLDENYEPVFNGEAGYKAVDLMKRQYAEGLVDPMATGWQNNDEIAAYMSGAAAMYEGWPARYIEATQPERSQIVGKSRVAPLAGENALIGGWYNVILSDGKNHEAAWKLIEFIASPGAQKEVILRGGDCNPTHKDVFFDPELQEKYEVLRAVGESFDKAKAFPQSTQINAIRALFNTYLPPAVYENADIQKALDDCADEVRQMLVDAGELES